MPKSAELTKDLGRAVERLAEASRRVAGDADHDALLRDGLIQRFEFCFELGWKAIEAKAAGEGVVVRSPKTALAHALAASWIHDEALWFRMLESRNLSSHTYNEAVAAELVANIPDFIAPLQRLLDALRA